jgi:cystathionine gamma-synthase
VSSESSDSREAAWRPATIAVHAGLDPDPASGAVTPPPVLSSTFVHGNPGGYEYGRDHNPTWERLEMALTALEGGAAGVVMASGMATIAAVLQGVPAGARVVAPTASYSGTRRLLGELSASGRVAVDLVDISDTDAVATACRGARLCLLETVTNPLLTIPDIRACAEAAHSAGARVAVDNTFATPLTVRPLRLGADVVIHSVSKYVGGHSDLVLGAAVAADAAEAERLREWRTAAGAIPGPFETWLALRGLRTLELRVRRQMQTAATLAARLEGHCAIARVHYPGLASHPQHERAAMQMHQGFGAIIAAEVEGGAEAAEAVCREVGLWTHATSLGGVESMLERRARYPLDAEVVAPGLLRLSVGIEDVEDLWDDLRTALDARR